MNKSPMWTLEQLQSVVEEAITLGYWITFNGAAEALGDVKRGPALGDIIKSASHFAPWMTALVYSRMFDGMYLRQNIVYISGEFQDGRDYIENLGLPFALEIIGEESGLWEERWINPDNVINAGRQGRTFTLDEARNSIVEAVAKGPSAANLKTKVPVVPAELARDYGKIKAKYRKHQTKLREISFQYAKDVNGTVACAVCGFDAETLLEAAHVIPDSMGGAASVKNIIILCATHHLALDRGHFEIDPASWPDWEIKATGEFREFETVWIVSP